MTALIPVTQADRDAVQAFHRAMLDKLMHAIKDKKAGARMGDDEGDAGTLVQAFARHRLAALTQQGETTPVSGDEVERVAEALWQADSERCTGRRRTIAWSDEGDKETRDGYRFNARAALAALHPTDQEAIRREALEGMPTIWVDPAGKGYSCYERPMTPAEAREAIERLGREADEARDAALEEAARVAETLPIGGGTLSSWINTNESPMGATRRHIATAIRALMSAPEKEVG